MDMIRTEQLTKYYGKSRGITNVSLEVGAGEFFGFIGPNGAGKSTTIRTLLGFLTPSSGRGWVDGLDIIKNREEILSRVGYLSAETVFYPGMRVRDILKLSAKLRKKDCARTAEMLCERLELDVSRKVEELSFGNRKKVGIVCALQHDPKLLVLDEPTSGLDPLMQKEFFDILRERNQAGTTVFLSSHILSEIQRYCTRAAIIRAGEIIACDSVGTLMKANTKRVSVRGVVELGLLDGVRDIQETPDGVSFLYSDEIGVLLKVLSGSRIQDLTITEPDLEESFLHYYEKGNGENDGSKA